MTPTFRASAPSTSKSGPTLGLLTELPGTWVGSGFNLIALPDHQDGKPFRLMLNATRETLTFSPIGAPIPNRGSAQNDIVYLGLTYLQEVSDAQTLGALHLEPGMWLNVPATTAPAEPATLVRLATVPHGNSVLAQGSGLVVTTPQIAPVSSKPTPAAGSPPLPLGYLDPYQNTPLPPAIPAGSIENPNLVLTNVIQGQKITSTTVLQVSTAASGQIPAGGIVNIPFITTNANATRLNAIFWIETVQTATGQTFLQLQYTQTIILNFLGIDWPHIAVATLVKH